MFNCIHIRSVEMADLKKVGGIQQTTGNCYIISREVNWEKIEIQDLADMKISEDFSGNEKQFKTILSFRARCRHITIGRQKVFRVESVNGDRYLIGLKSRPFPVIKETTPFPADPETSVLKDVEVIWIAAVPALKAL